MTTPKPLPNEEELEEKTLALFRRMSICAAIHQAKDAVWVDGKCATPTTATNEAMHLFREYAKGYAREIIGEDITAIDGSDQSAWGEDYKRTHDTQVEYHNAMLRRQRSKLEEE